MSPSIDELEGESMVAYTACAAKHERWTPEPRHGPLPWAKRLQIHFCLIVSGLFNYNRWYGIRIFHIQLGSLYFERRTIVKLAALPNNIFVGSRVV
jgi:hypothetical protein